MKKGILLALYMFALGLTAFAQRPDARDPEQLRNSVFVNINGGVAPASTHLSKTVNMGYFGQASVNVFVRHNISAGVDYSYNHFPDKKNSNRGDYYLHEVLLQGAFYFKSSWHPYLSVGFGYYGNYGQGLFGFTPGIGFMKRVANRVYITAKGSFVLIDSNSFAKIGVGVAFQVYKHKPFKASRPGPIE